MRSFTQEDGEEGVAVMLDEDEKYDPYACPSCGGHTTWGLTYEYRRTQIVWIRWCDDCCLTYAIEHRPTDKYVYTDGIKPRVTEPPISTEGSE